MAGKSNKLKIKKLQINLTNRWLYTLIVFFSLVVIGVGVYAYGTSNPATFGHSAGELEGVCLSDGTNCPSLNGGGGSLWSQTGSNIYYNTGNVGIGTTTPSEKLHVAGHIQAAPYTFISSVYSGTDTVLGYNVKYDPDDSDRLNVVSGAGTIHPQAIILGPGEGIRFLTSSSNPGAGADWLLNSYEKMRITPAGNVNIAGNVYANAFVGDGSGLMNIIVKITATNDVCNSGNDGLLRYRNNYCAGDDIRSSTLDICMRTGGSSYGWSSLQVRTWSDTSCDTDGCPPGQNYYECRYTAPPGCYYSQPYNCYWSCFLAGTEILIADGTYKNIEQVKEGEWVVSYDIDNNLKTISKVAYSSVHENVEGYVIINGELEVTSNHPMWIVNRQEWAQVHTIELGDILLDSNGQEIIVISLENINGVNTVYNLELEGEYKNYFAGDILVHNKLPGDWVP